MSSPTERDRQRLSNARVGRLASVMPAVSSSHGHTDTSPETLRPHLVPCCFVLLDNTIYSAVDGKPKSTTALKRLANIRAHPRASLLVDRFSEDWTELWWVRADGPARVIDHGAEWTRAINHLVDKYQQYAAMRPEGAAVAIDVDEWQSWSASG